MCSFLPVRYSIHISSILVRFYYSGFSFDNQTTARSISAVFLQSEMFSHVNKPIQYFQSIPYFTACTRCTCIFIYIFFFWLNLCREKTQKIGWNSTLPCIDGMKNTQIKARTEKIGKKTQNIGNQTMHADEQHTRSWTVSKTSSKYRKLSLHQAIRTISVRACSISFEFHQLANWMEQQKFRFGCALVSINLCAPRMRRAFLLA